ncbi:hypothetical protein PR202_ga13656 [Eleusine coracana subsp. coracana]|uniref:DUF3741 domain-containing protein n=1 Tax=Eleusine coracana subsp. coracana TaxID=191504 RepID=A0AAV5CFC4_ELECO|nr:hypothetical protein PR202_ga13656 [Eleusine coracana subsp. coracana]
MAKVPDLGSDFAQKLLKDLRRRRERLGFESAAVQRSTANIAPRASRSSSEWKSRINNKQISKLQFSKQISYRQDNNSTVGSRKPRNHGSPASAPIAHSQAIVPFQGGDRKPKPAANVDMQMALALALSNSSKLQNLQLVESNGGNYLLSPSAHVGKVAIGVQKLNDILMAYTSDAGMRGFDKRGSVEVGKQLLRGAMDLEESLNMLMMLQEASDYLGSSGNDKVLLLEGKESRRSSPRPSSSARLVEIVDEDSEAELGSDAKGSSHASMQIVPLGKSQGSSANHRSTLQLTTVRKSSKSNVTSDQKDGSKVRMPNLIAKLMGLENLPSAKVAAERKATERFVRRDAVPRKVSTTNAFSTLPIRIVGSEGMPSKGQIKNFLARDWTISLTKSEESERATVLSNMSSHLTADKQTMQTMRQVLSKQENTDRRVSVTQAIGEKIVHQGGKLTEESKLQKTVGVGCSSDRKMNFLQRFRKNATSKPVTKEKDISQGSNKKLGKLQAIGIKQSGIDREVKSRRTREKFNKENLSAAENKPEVRNGKTNQLRRQTQNKQTNKQIVDKRLQNYHQIQNETANQILEDKRSLKLEATHTKEKVEYTTLIQLKNGECSKVGDTAGRKPSYNKPNNDTIFRYSAAYTKDTSTTRGLSSDQSEKLPEEIKDPTTAVAKTSAGSIAEATVNNVNEPASEAKQVVEIFSEGEQLQQQLQLTKDVDDPSRNDFNHILKSCNPRNLKSHKIDVMACNSFTETQLLLKEMMLKDHYLLETAKSITRIHVPASAAHVNIGKWLDKNNKVLSDIGREVLRRKGKRTEAMVNVSMTNSAMLRLKTLDDLIRELDVDIQSLDIPNMKPQQQSGNSPAENLKMVLRSDIENTHPDANSVWDFGWNRIWDLPIDKNEVVKDLEKNILGGIITDVAKELIDVSICHG